MVRERNREATEQLLRQSLGKLLAEKGFNAVGVNAVAREAGVDKVLIYRYFGGLNGLLKEFALSAEFWPGLSDIVGDDVEAFLSLPRGEMLSTAMINYARFMRDHPLSLEIETWFLVESNELTREFSSTRASIFNSIGDRLSQADSPTDVDAWALGNFLGAAIAFIAMARRRADNFHNPLINSDEGWDVMESLIHSICSRMAEDSP